MISPRPIHRILLVDDHSFLRAGLRATLVRILPDVEIFEAGEGLEALDLFARHRPDLVLLDVHLPGMNGLDILRRLRSSDPTTHVIMVAADADPWTVRQAMDAGAVGFISKISASNVLQEAILAVSGGHPFLCERSRTALEHSSAPTDPAHQEPGPSVLSDRERQILRYLAQGENTKSIAALLSISPKTVETHRSHLMWKLGLEGVAALTRYAIRHGLTTP